MGRDGMSPRLQLEVAEQFRCPGWGAQKRFRLQAEQALIASRRDEQQALMRCEQTEQIMLSEYQHNLRLCQQEGNQGTQYLQME
eukprot:8698795-Prorocentrum_lima.AAC.1